MRSSLLLLLPVLAVIAISGCVTGGGGSGPGVAILQFVPDFSQVNSGENVLLQLRLQNQGDRPAENVEVELGGIDMSEWGTFGTFTTTQNLGRLIERDLETNIPGQEKTHTWTLRAPLLQRGTTFTYQPIAYVEYDYSTIATIPISIADQNEMRRIIESGETISMQTASYTSGPLSVQITTKPVVKSTGLIGTGWEGQAYDIFPVEIKITNTQLGAGGTIVPRTFTSPGMLGGGAITHPVEVRVTPPTGTGLSARFIGGDFTGQDCSHSFVTNLFRGQDVTITCELDVTSPPTTRTETLMTVELVYRYRTEARTSVSVIGTELARSLY